MLVHCGKTTILSCLLRVFKFIAQAGLKSEKSLFKELLCCGLFLLCGCNNHCQVVEQALSEAEPIRQLKSKAKLRCEVRTPDAVRAHLRHLITEKVPAARLEYEEVALKALGIIPNEFNYSEGLIAAYSEQIGGFYDPEKKSFVLLEGLSAEAILPIAIHEVTHALQDQYYDLNALVNVTEMTSDEQLAKSALVEGDATLVMYDFERKRRGQPGVANEASIENIVAPQKEALESSAKNLPQSLRKLIAFPYIAGSYYVHRLKRENRLSAAFLDPPKFSAQILGRQSACFLQPEKIVFAKVGDLLFRDSLGQFFLEVFFEIHNIENFKTMAASWCSDELTIKKTSGISDLRWVIQFENENAAEDFLNSACPKLKDFSRSLSCHCEQKKCQLAAPVLLN